MGHHGQRGHDLDLPRPLRPDGQKKSAHAAEQDRPDILEQREAWFEGQLDLDPARLVFIDETGASTNMARLRGRAPKGERLRAGIPKGHWKTTTFVAGLRLTGMVAPMVLDGPMNRSAFLAYVQQVLVPTLAPGDITSTCCTRSEEHTSELQSRQYLVCRLLLEKKKKRTAPSRLPPPALYTPPLPVVSYIGSV